MPKFKPDATARFTIAAGCVVMAAAAVQLGRMGAVTEQGLPAFFGEMRWIMLALTAVVVIVAALLSSRLDELAAKTEAQHEYPPAGVDTPPNGLADACSGERALMVAARLRGYSLGTRCLGIAACLVDLVCAFRI